MGQALGSVAHPSRRKGVPSTAKGRVSRAAAALPLILIRGRHPTDLERHRVYALRQSRKAHDSAGNKNSPEWLSSAWQTCFGGASSQETDLASF